MLVEAGCSDPVIAEAAEGDLSREIYCISGNADRRGRMPSVLRRIDIAAATS
jgi:hypothetical protein